VPVTTRLLHRLNEALGDDAADDLLACFHEASEVNRAAVRELAELYITRSEARIDQRMAELGGDLHAALGVHRGDLQSALGDLRGDLQSALGVHRGEVGAALGEFRGVVGTALGQFRGEVGTALGQFRGEVGAALGEFRGEVRSALGELRGEMHSGLANQRAELLKWMFLFWAGTVVPLAGLILATQRP
jgi:hypothetical protein